MNQIMSAGKKIILALDVSEYGHARELVEKFKDYIEIYKMGLELFISCGPKIVEDINKKGKKVFLDLKFHDIPNTVSKAAIASTPIFTGSISVIIRPELCSPNNFNGHII